MKRVEKYIEKIERINKMPIEKVRFYGKSFDSLLNMGIPGNSVVRIASSVIRHREAVVYKRHCR